MGIAGRIDHTLLRADATEKEIVQLCHEAVKYGFASVCVNPTYIGAASRLLHGSSVLPCTVIGFPLGASMTEAKIQEILAAKAHGAKEVDVVMNISRAKSGDWKTVQRDIEQMVVTAQNCGLVIKVIIETALLQEEEKKIAAEIVKNSGADYIKTSTGFAGGGATLEDIRNFKTWVGDQVKIKASGGIKTKEFAQQLLDAGADRLGASAGIALVE